MAATLADMFHVDIASTIVSRTAASSQVILNVFGMQPGGPAVRTQRGRRFGYDIVNRSRKPAGVRGPTQPAATIRKKIMGHVDGNMIQVSEKIPVLYEEIGMLRPLGVDATRSQLTLEPFGEDKIRANYVELGDRDATARTLGVLGMMRGSLYGHMSGEEIILTFDSTLSGADVENIFEVDFQLPATNTDRLTNLRGDGAAILSEWTTSTDIPGQLDKINEGLINQTGNRLEVIMCNSNTWNIVLNNTKVATQAGSVNTPFDTFEVQVGTDRDGRPMTVRRATLRCRPMYEFYIIDEMIDIGLPNSETPTKMIPDGKIWGGQRPRSDRYAMLEGSYLVQEQLGQQAQERYGVRVFSKEIGDPPGREIHLRDMFMPANYVPAASIWGDISAA